MRESELEKQIVKRIKELGGWSAKIFSKLSSGLPDRICVIPGYGTFFMELKTLDGRLSLTQESVIFKIRKAEGRVLIVRSLYGFNNLLQEIKK